MFTIGKLSLIILTRCNLRCKLCCEYVPQNEPFPDMTVEEEKRILEAAFDVIDHVDTLHLTGGGEPFLHPHLAEMTEEAMEYSDRFDRLMLFTNSLVPVSERLAASLEKHRDKIVVQTSQYGKNTAREQTVLKTLEGIGVTCKVVRYYGEVQDFGGWVDFGAWEKQGKEPKILEKRFSHCAVTEAMHGNWRTRDGKVHWCSRSQRGMELGLIPDYAGDYVDLLDQRMSREQKQDAFKRIAASHYLNACDHCSGDQGTTDTAKRFPAAEQMEG